MSVKFVRLELHGRRSGYQTRSVPKIPDSHRKASVITRFVPAAFLGLSCVVFLRIDQSAETLESAISGLRHIDAVWREKVPNVVVTSLPHAHTEQFLSHSTSSRNTLCSHANCQPL